MTRQPQGFHLAALCAALFCTITAAVAVMLEPGMLAPGETVAVRGAAALLAVLSGVEAEALMHAHPWALRAAQALALAWVFMLTPLFVWLGGSPVSYWMLACSGVIVVPLVLYVRHHTAGAFQQGARISRPTRRP